VALGDLDSDRKIDCALASDDSSSLRILRGDGAGRFTPFPGSPIDVGAMTTDVGLGDVDGDGKLDVLTMARGTLVVLKGDGRGKLTRFEGGSIRAGDGVWSLTVADLNGDGRADVVAPDSLRDRVVVFLAR
jgi:hypothetical protein